MNPEKPKQQTNQHQQASSMKDKNLTFIGNLDSEYEDQGKQNNKKFNESLQFIKKHLKGLDELQRQQWAHLLELKCASLQRKSKITDLKTNIRKLVLICTSMNIGYNKDLIERLIKSIYYEKYGTDIVQLFIKSGYNTEQYQFINYSQPWYSKLLSIFSSD